MGVFSIRVASATVRRPGFVSGLRRGAPMAFLDTLNRLLGDPNEKELKRLRPMIAVVRKAGQDPAIRALTLETVPAKTAELKARIQSDPPTSLGGTEKVLNKLLPEAFAVAIRT